MQFIVLIMNDSLLNVLFIVVHNISSDEGLISDCIVDALYTEC